MHDRPSSLWKQMPLEKRVRAADAFWRDTDSPEIEVQHAEATMALARRLNFRMRSIQSLPIAKRARHLANLSEVSDALATRALIAYHFAHQRPLMAGFLEAVGIAHDNGLITEEDVKAPDPGRLETAVSTLRSSFDHADVDLYLRTLLVLDGETWKDVQRLVSAEQGT